jgi:hypothetical protein
MQETSENSDVNSELLEAISGSTKTLVLGFGLVHQKLVEELINLHVFKSLTHNHEEGAFVEKTIMQRQKIHDLLHQIAEVLEEKFTH